MDIHCHIHRILCIEYSTYSPQNEFFTAKHAVITTAIRRNEKKPRLQLPHETV
jgi:hypothetical protein